MAGASYEVDWSTLPAPEDDGAATHLPGLACPGAARLDRRRDAIKRMSLAIENGRIEHVIYPVFPPDRNAELVADWLKRR